MKHAELREEIVRMESDAFGRIKASLTMDPRIATKEEAVLGILRQSIKQIDKFVADNLEDE